MANISNKIFDYGYEKLNYFLVSKHRYKEVFHELDNIFSEIDEICRGDFDIVYLYNRKDLNDIINGKLAFYMEESNYHRFRFLIEKAIHLHDLNEKIAEEEKYDLHFDGNKFSYDKDNYYLRIVKDKDLFSLDINRISFHSLPYVLYDSNDNLVKISDILLYKDGREFLVNFNDYNEIILEDLSSGETYKYENNSSDLVLNGNYIYEQRDF